MREAKFLAVVAVFLIVSIEVSPQEVAGNVVEPDAPNSERPLVQSEDVELEHSERFQEMSNAFDRLAEELSGIWEQHKVTSLLEATIDEVGSVFVSLVEKYDTNDDGGLSWTELESVSEDDLSYEYKLLPVDKRQSRREDEFNLLDRDKDGIVTSDEVTTAMGEILKPVSDLTNDLELFFISLFKKYDSNGDGGLSLKELEKISEDDMGHEFKYLPREKQLSQLAAELKQLDRDSDGNITPDEVSLSVNEIVDGFAGSSPHSDGPHSTDKERQTDSTESDLAD